ncbi:hypothetical protein QFC21_004199 [Naganishia friedmannii]|uniref:Uncharacterized protein n=1 Tax=Naganishia friedmannii TaxID=89922 RepID=A0ACC2VJR3_9TREE|nr:hypothetical protein QFC21_004199 [Naganishia friedmannii]
MTKYMAEVSNIAEAVPSSQVQQALKDLVECWELNFAIPIADSYQFGCSYFNETHRNKLRDTLTRAEVELWKLGSENDINFAVSGIRSLENFLRYDPNRDVNTVVNPFKHLLTLGTPDNDRAIDNPQGATHTILRQDIVNIINEYVVQLMRYPDRRNRPSVLRRIQEGNDENNPPPPYSPRASSNPQWSSLGSGYDDYTPYGTGTGPAIT